MIALDFKINFEAKVEIPKTAMMSK